MTMEEMNDKSLFEGAADNADLLEKLLKASLIHADETYQTPPQIIWVDNSTIATLGNFSASTGKAKSRKTFNVSALVAASLANGKVLQYTAKLPDDKRKILYVDTEQSRFHCHSVMQRILRLAGLPDNMNSENLVFFGLREYSPNLRLRLIEYALQTQKGFGLVIIDGIRDLMLDINNPSESVHIINKLMQWSSRYDLHIHCVLHLNKGDDNVRGHIGTELSNKAETVLVISKSNSMANVSEVKPLNIRDKDFAPFAFQINKEGLPEIAKDYVVDSTIAKQPKMTIADITDEQHDKALGMAFGKKVVSGYENVINALTKGYTTIGFARGRTVMSKLLTFLLKSKLVVKCGNNEYCRMKDYPSLPLATLGNFSASTGKAKSRKTFNVSALVAASLANGKVLQYTAKLPDDKRKILYVDTEQSRFHCHSVMQRILRLAGLPDNMNSENLVFFGLREYSPNLRLRLIEYALQTQKGFGLVIIDGIRDLMLDINNPSESVHIINKLMQWSSRYDLHIHCVLHLNKGDDNVRGHIGTELSNKAETVLVISKSNSMANVSEVKPLNIRDKDFAPFAFQINKEGLPEIAKDYVVDSTIAKQPKMTIADITDEQHDKALGMAFGKKVVSGYENVINALTKGYTTIGFARGRTVMSKLLTFLLKSKLVVKCGNNEYCRMKDYPSLPLLEGQEVKK